MSDAASTHVPDSNTCRRKRDTDERMKSAWGPFLALAEARAVAKVSIAHTGDCELGDAVQVSGEAWGEVTAIDTDAGVVTIASLAPPTPRRKRPEIILGARARPPNNRHKRRAEAAKARRR